MQNKSILISGASIAGPALAYWLTRYGYQVTVVERAPEVRDGGYKVDIRGAAVDVMERMGLMEKARTRDTAMRGATFVKANNRPVAQLDAALWGMREQRDAELMRGDIMRLFYEATCDRANYIFGDSITAMEQTAEGVDVSFERGAPQRYHAVIGADGLHSNVRRLAFGPEANYLHSAGPYYVAVCSVPNHMKLDRWELLHVVPKRSINLYCTQGAELARALFIFHQDGLQFDPRDREQQRRILAEVFANVGWEAPRLLEAAATAPDFFLDSISQVRMDTWHTGRIALLGDAGYAPSLASGQGTSQAIVGAYVLAGELARANGDCSQAFPRYQAEMRHYVDKNLALGENVRHMVAHSRFEVGVHGLMMKMMPWLPWANTLVEKIGAQVRVAAHAIAVKDYPLTSAPSV